MKSNKIMVLLILASLITSACSRQGLPEGTSSPGSTQAAATGGIGMGQTSTSPATTPPVTVPPATTPPGTTPPATKPPATREPIVRSLKERLVEQYEGRIYPGILISGFQVGGLTWREAEEKLERTREKALDRRISFTVGDEKYRPTQKELGVHFDFTEALEEAKEAYANLSIAEKAHIIETGPKLRLYLEKTVDEDKLKAFSKKVQEETFREASLKVSGRRVYRRTLENDLTERIRFSTKDPESFKASAEYTARLEPPKPKADPESQRGTIATGKSEYAESNYNRSFNLKRGTARLEGVVIRPGETFSFNRTVGAASKRNGYKLAAVYSGETMEEGYGGGICQVSSTLYNAVVRAGLKIVERHTHAFTVTYLPKGMDATIYYPSLDLKFKNTLDYPITIRTSAGGGELKIRFVADKRAMGGISYKFSRDLLWEGEEAWTTTYTSDLAPGEREIVYYPHPAAEVNVYRTTLKNGEEIRTEWFDNVSYRQLKGLRLEGRD